MAFDSYQIEAIEDNSKSAIITASAGAGKTTTMIARTLRAINHPNITRQLSSDAVVENIDPSQIQMLSFTNVAADTFKTRLSEVSDGKADNISVSTIDKFAIRILQYAYPFAKCDLDESEVARTLYYDLNDQTHLQQQYKKFSDYFTIIEEGEKKYARSTERQMKEEVYDAYLDFYVDHILTTYKKEDSFSIPLQVVYKFAVLTMLTHQYVPNLKMIIVDELQDTSDEQFLLLNFLQSQIKDLKFIGIGDVSQSMYRWNNAKPQRVAQYIDEYDATVKTLPNNYRSHPEIIDLANKMLEHNLDNISDIRMIPKRDIRNFDQTIEDEHRVQYMRSVMDIYPKLAHLMANGVEPKDIAIVARSGNQLDKIKDYAPARYKFADNQRSKNKQISFLSYLSRTISLYSAQVADQREIFENISDFLYKYDIVDDHDAFKTYYRNLRKTNPEEYRKTLAKRLDKFKENLVKRMRDLLFNTKSDVPEKNEITLSTVHGIKGEEFDYVFYIPPMKNVKNEVHVDKNLTQEEKELLWGQYSELQNIDYVAITRAKEQLFIVSHEVGLDRKIQELDNRIAKNLSYNRDAEALYSKYKR